MKKTLFKRLFNAKASIAFSLLLGGILLLYACSGNEADDENLDTNAIENIGLGDENSMKLVVDGKFKEFMTDINSIDDTLYKYIMVNSDDNVVEAYTNEESFKNFDDYDTAISEMNYFKSESTNGDDQPDISQDVAEKAFIDLLLEDQNNVVSKSFNVNDFSFIFNHSWPNHTGGLVGHFEGSAGGRKYFNVTKLRTNALANNQTTHSHLENNTSVRILRNHHISSMFSVSSKVYVRNTNDEMSRLYLYTSTNFSGTQYRYTIQKNRSVVVPRRYFRSLRIINF